MTGYQESVNKMSVASASFVSNNETITATLPGFAPLFEIIQTSHSHLLRAIVQQETDKSGDTNNKKHLKIILIGQTMDIVRRTIAYATNVNNNALLALVGYSESDLSKASDTKLVGICQVINDNAFAQVEDLGVYGVTPAILTAQQDSITNFSTAIPKDRVDTTDSSAATKLIGTLIKTITSTWAKIDILVEIVKVTQPAFYNEYHSVRKVIDTGSSSLSLKVKASDAHSGDGVANVTLSVSSASTQIRTISSSNKKADVKKTANGGGAHYKSLPDGDYVITATKPGFKDVTVTISVVNGESTVLEIPMEKA